MEKVMELLKSGQDCQKRSCKATEFELGTEKLIKGNMSIEFATWLKNNLVLEFSFDVQYSTRDLRTEKFFKVVHTEYLINTLMSLMGNIGGTLGMFVGFSFISIPQMISETFLSIFWKGLQKISTKCSS